MACHLNEVHLTRIRKLRQAELTNYEIHFCILVRKKNLKEEYENHTQLSTNSSRHTIMDEDKQTSHTSQRCIYANS